ncbi:MAG: tetratricopeptide repeat protein [Bdellovibrionales bacterium]|nr:tetratricopeptide repeat protein [Bdellovibrionales bacterium]
MILLSSSLYAQDPETLLSQGILQFSQKDWDGAENNFQKALELAPSDPNILSNLALVQIEKGNDMLAYAFWRKALYYHPFFTSAQQGLEYLKKKGKIQAPDYSTFATVFHNLYRSPSLYSYLVLWIFLFLCLKSAHSYLLSKKLANEEESPAPALPLRLIFYGVFLIVSVCFTVSQALDKNATRGLSLEPSITKLGPSAESPNLFTLNPGDSIEILSEKDSWVQVENQQEQRAWIEKDKIFVF